MESSVSKWYILTFLAEYRHFILHWNNKKSKEEVFRSKEVCCAFKMIITFAFVSFVLDNGLCHVELKFIY